MGFSSPPPSLVEYAPHDRRVETPLSVPFSFSFLGQDSGGRRRGSGCPLASLGAPPSSLVLRLPADPGAQRRPKRARGREGAPLAEAAWAEDVRHGECGQQEGGGTWKPAASGWQPGLKSKQRGVEEGALAHIRGSSSAPEGASLAVPYSRGIGDGGRIQFAPVISHWVWGLTEWEKES